MTRVAAKKRHYFSSHMRLELDDDILYYWLRTDKMMITGAMLSRSRRILLREYADEARI